MPKSKKKKRQDFQKVKLKVGKRLPKGDNVTNLSFKTRQIQLTQRLKEDDGQGLFTKKKENVQDLLRQCDHYSCNSRLSAVMGLREIWLADHTELMVPTNVHGYSAVLKKLSSLLIDGESTVRHAAVNLFKVILHKLTRETTAHIDRLLGGSLFSHLHTYLCCAMNHVHEDVRLDALLLYDVLLETCPALVVRQTGGLLRNLVGLLTTPSLSQMSSRGDVTAQKLSLNPERRLPVKLFRVKVLSRIKQTLTAALNDKLDRSGNCHAPLEGNLVWSLHNDHSNKRKAPNTIITSRTASNRFQTMLNGGSHDLDDYITNPASLKSFVDLCVPVMVQCWREARSDSDMQHESTGLLSSDSMDVILLAVSVIQLLFVLSSNAKKEKSQGQADSLSLMLPKEGVTNFEPTLEKLLMAGFPYSAQVDAVPNKKKKKHIGSKIQTNSSSKASVSDLNLGVCDIMSTMCTNCGAEVNKVLVKKMSRHVTLLLREAPSTSQCRVVIRVIRNVFLNPNTAGFFTKVYKAALQNYFAATPKSQNKKMFYGLFAEMGQVWDGWSRTRDSMEPESVFRYKANQDIEDTLVGFFQSLPTLAVTAHSLGDVEWTLSVLRLMRHGHVHFHSAPFSDNLTQVLDPVQGLFASSDEDVQKNVCAVISTGTPFAKDNLRQLLHLLRCPPENPAILNRKSSSCVSHVLFAMFANIRACVPLNSQLEVKQMTASQHQLLSDYLRFLFSLQIGFTGEDLDKICPSISGQEQKQPWLDIIFTVSEAQWKRHVEISEIVASEVANFRLEAEPDLGFKSPFTFLDNFEHFWIQTFSAREKIHVLSVLGLTKLVVQAFRPSLRRRLGPELQSLAGGSVAALLACMYDQESTDDVTSELIWQVKAELTQCLASTGGSAMLESVMELLAKRAAGEFNGDDNDKQAAKSAQDFLLTNEALHQKLNPQKKL